MSEKRSNFRKFSIAASVALATALVINVSSCTTAKKTETLINDDTASKVYVPPGKHDELYAFMSGGFSGQVAAYGLPSGRLLKVIPVFSQNPENAYGYSEETKPMLQTSHGFIPWGDAHHPQLSKTDGIQDGRWLFINENNTPRVARIDLATFKTVEIVEIPNIGGNHGSPFITDNTEYVVSATRFSVPVDDDKRDVPLTQDSYKKNFKGLISYVKVDKNSGAMDLSFQVKVPGYDYDLSRSGKNASKDWSFFTSYNTEQANSMLEANASQKDKDFILAVNWKKLEEYVAQGKAKTVKTEYFHNKYDEEHHTAKAEKKTEVKMLDSNELKDLGMLYYIPCPKSPHGVDVDPSGEYIVGAGKLATVIPVFSFTKMQKAIEEKQFEGEVDGIPILKYDSVLHGEVKEPGLGPLHTEFDDKGNAYTSMFVSSEIVKWEVKTQKVLDRVPTYYSIGHLMVPGGDSKKPFGKYVVALNKITKDRYLPTGPELTQSAQLYDITGDKMKLLLDFPTIGEPHYAQAIEAEKVVKIQKKFFPIEENKSPFAIKGEKETRVERKGNDVHIYMSTIRSHFSPDTIEGINVGDNVYFHLTNLEQEWDVPHGFSVKGAENSELLIMPGETQTLKWTPKKSDIFPFYCTDFCSALHQEMQGYIRVSPQGSKTPLKFTLNNEVIGK